MIRMNLLPHREAKRKARRQQFFGCLGATVIVSGLIVFLGHEIISSYISRQESRNNYLKKEIAVLDKNIDEIKRLKEQTNALLSRKRIIESLQGSRAEAVQLLNTFAREVPNGIFLKHIKQAGPKITLTGYAQSPARVATLIRNLDASPLLEKPTLEQIKTAILDKRRLSEFILSVLITAPELDIDKKTPAPAQNKSSNKKGKKS